MLTEIGYVDKVQSIVFCFANGKPALCGGKGEYCGEGDDSARKKYGIEPEDVRKESAERAAKHRAGAPMRAILFIIWPRVCNRSGTLCAT
jgi:hypothetical protein